MPSAAMSKQLIVGLDNVRDQVASLIKESFDKALAAIAEDIRNKHGFSCEASIQGLREQITANVTILLGFMKNSSNTTFSLNSKMSTASQIKIVTLGQEPQMRAVIFVGHATGAKKFLHGEKVATTATALSSLLKRTEKLLEGHIEGVTSANSKRTTATVRTTTAADAQHFHMTTHDKGFWDSDSVNNNSFHDTGSFSSDGLNDSGFESGDGQNTPNHSFSSDTTVADDDMPEGNYHY